MPEFEKLNIGGGPRRITGYKNVDALLWDGATDYVLDITKERVPLPNNSVEHIISIEFLEHISFRHTFNVLKEFYRLLRPGASLYLQVPDAGKAMEYYVNDQICDCVPHKAPDMNFEADPNCKNCGGRAKINPVRWHYTFCGAQKHPFDAHLNVFTENDLKKILAKVGFRDIESTYNIYKIVLNATK